MRQEARDKKVRLGRRHEQMQNARIITCDADVAEGAAWLASRSPAFAAALAHTGPLPLRLRAPGFAGLLEVIVGQQVSVASANAIKARLGAAGLICERSVRAGGPDGLRAAGLSGAKTRYALALAEAALDYDALAHAPDDEVFATLTAVKGIGPWTAQIYLMFCLGRADAFAPGDLALQVAAQSLFGLEARPNAAALARMAEDWRPWRSVAARALFAYYRVLKNREGLP